MVTGGAVTGAVLGGVLSKRISAKVLRRLFGLFVIGVAVYVMYQSITEAIISSLTIMLSKHVEFLLGIASLSICLLLFRFGQWIHRHDNGISNYNH